MRPVQEGQKTARFEAFTFGAAYVGAIALAGGGAALGFAAYDSTYNNLSADHAAQLQAAESAATSLLDQYGDATSSLPEACRLVIKDAMKGSLDNPLDIINAANKSGTCQGNMDKITTVTYQYHDKMLERQKDITAANDSLAADSNAAGWVGGPVGVVGALGGWGLGFGLMMRIPLGRRKAKDESVQAAIDSNDTNPAELTTGKNEEQAVTPVQETDQPNKFVVGYEEYAHQGDMK